MRKSYIEKPELYAREMIKNRIKCKCGHSNYVPPMLDKVVCSWCGNYVFKDKKAEFQFRLKEATNNGK